MKSTSKLIPFTIFILMIGGCGLLSQSDADQAALDSLRDAGSDLNKVHPFDFYLYHPDQAGAAQLCSHLQADGFQVTVREGALEGEWLCLASLSFIPSIEKLSELRGKLEGLIEQFGGEYDGWETLVIP
jgi:hypothetical protein